MIRSASGMLVGLLIATSGFAAPPVRIIRADLEPLIRAAASSSTQFAVNVPEAVSTSTAGSWSIANGRATWRYAVRIPTAVSLSFHATRVALPHDAQLTVRGNSTASAYRSVHVHHDELWSRIHPGDTLDLTIDVAARDRDRTIFEIASFQAGYRSLGPGVKDHPIYRRIIAKQSGTGNSSCVQNYECNVTATNTAPAQATVGLVIGNLFQCSGTLINDVPGDNVPYVLTARHCESGHLGGGNPGAASSITVYWDATTACGQALGSLYDWGIPTQTGATTVVEQQDAWLVRLDETPVVPDAQFAGFDASGGTVQGGYTAHHALGYDKQFTGWFDQAAPVQMTAILGSTYVSNFWETVNQLGNIGPGASGSALFDQNDHLVGSLTLGRTTQDTSGYESCPNPSPPDGTNGTADFTSLAIVWSSTADSTSTTGSATLQSVLDPGLTGTLVVASAPVVTMTFTAGTTSLSVGSFVTLSWTVVGSTQCVASGGASGDGWGGNVTAQSSQSLTETVQQSVTYTLTCAVPGGRSVTKSIVVTWGPPTPWINVASANNRAWVTRPATLYWRSNVTPCSISGGSLALTNLPSSGSTTTTAANTGDVQYAFSCGPSGNSATAYQTISYITPSFVFEQNGTDRLVGQPLYLWWASLADTCTPSGGGPDDGWTATAFANPGTLQQFTANDTTSGTYTFTLTCTSGPISVTNSVSATFETNAPYVSATIDKLSETYSGTAADTFSLSWNSNLTVCIPSVSPAGIPPLSGGNPLDTGTWVPPAPGNYTLAVACRGANGVSPVAASAPITVTVLPPPPPTTTLSIVPSTVGIGQPFTVAWSSMYAQSCTGNGGTPSDAFNISQPAGSGTWTSSTLGQYAFSIDCQSIGGVKPDGTAQATVTITGSPPTVTVSATPSTPQQGSTFTLTWSSANALSCAASGGGASNTPWGGSVALFGAPVESADVIGTFGYTVTCTNGPYAAQATATVTVTAPPPPTATLSSSSSSVTVGQAFTLTWSSSNAAGCVANGGGADGTAWSGALSLSGTASQTATTTGTFTYTVTCDSGSQSFQAKAIVSVSAAASGGGSGGGGHGGGGAFDLEALAALGTVLAIRLSRRSPMDHRRGDPAGQSGVRGL
jgi:hypothetical protein